MPIIIIGCTLTVFISGTPAVCHALCWVGGWGGGRSLILLFHTFSQLPSDRELILPHSSGEGMEVQRGAASCPQSYSSSRLVLRTGERWKEGKARGRWGWAPPHCLSLLPLAVSSK